MPDSTLVLPPGWRATDVNGVPLSGAVVIFYNAATSTAREVFGLASLVAGSTLGNEIVCDAGGYPTSDGNSKTLIWTGIDAYRIRLETSAGAAVWDHDLITGALDTSDFGGDATTTTPVLNVSTDQSLAAGATGKLYVANCSGGDITFTLGLASVLGDGWRVGIRHGGTANQIKIISGDTAEGFVLPGMRGTEAGITTAITDAFALATFGQEVWLRCDGANFSIGEPTPPAINLTGIWLIAGRLATPPGSPVDGARYIVTTSPTAAWASFAVGDIAEADGQGGWIRYTPPTDCGHIAYVQDEDIYYRFIGTAWSADRFAVQSEMEARTAGFKVSADVQHYHPGHPKAWGIIDTGLGFAGYGIASVSNEATGSTGITWSTAFTSVNYCPVVGVSQASFSLCTVVTQHLAGSMTMRSTLSTNGVATDPSNFFVIACGDQ